MEDGERLNNSVVRLSTIYNCRRARGPMLGRFSLIGLLYFAAEGWLCCVAQTNGFSPPAPAFFQPGLQLRQHAPSVSANATVTSQSGPVPPENVTRIVTSKAELSSSTAQGLHISFVRTDQFYLVRSEPPAFQHGGNRFLDQVFRPEEFRVGKFAVSSPIATAVKRKNPLCLLNPIVFQASW